MGYQESYLTTKNPKDFDKLVAQIKKAGPNYYHNRAADPVEIITLLQPIDSRVHKGTFEPYQHFSYPAGTQFIYFTGDRSIQRNVIDLLGIYPNDLAAFTLVSTSSIIFTEYFPSHLIFTKNIPSQYATMQPWEW